MAPTKEKISTPSQPNSREVLQEERYLWMSRAFVVMVVLAVICDLVLLIALANVTPIMRVQPFYIQTRDRNEQIIDILRPSAETLNSNVLKESFIRQYLLARYTISSDLDEQRERWFPGGPVEWMSSESVYSLFEKKELSVMLPLAEKENTTRNVDIRVVNRARAQDGEESDDTYVAEMALKTMNKASSRPEVVRYEARLRVAFLPIKKVRTRAQRLKNPLGFTVVDFGLKRLDPEDSTR